MVEIVEKPTIAPGPKGDEVKIYPFERWLLPYRGSKYSLIEKKIDGKRRLVVVWKYRDIEPIYNRDKNKIPKLPENLLSCFRRIGKNRGSFKVTPKREVVTKVENEKGEWVPYYLGKLKGKWNFGNNIDLDPDISPFSVWTGLPFNHGESWSVWVREGSGSKLYWKCRIYLSSGFPKTVQQMYFNSIKEYPNLIRLYLDARPSGGRLYINEYGHIWMNLRNSDVGTEYRDRIKNNINNVLETFGGNVRLIHRRLRETGCWPIYLGNVEDYDHGESPRTYFNDLNKYFKHLYQIEDYVDK